MSETHDGRKSSFPKIRSIFVRSFLYTQNWASKTLWTSEQSLYHRTCQAPLREMIYKRQLKFKGHFICMQTVEFTDRFVIFKCKIRSYLRSGAKMTTCLSQILSDIAPSKKTLLANKISQMPVKKSE